MSRLRADKLVNRAATGAPQLTYGASIPVGYGLTGAGDINITGIVTATTFIGSLTGTATTATLATNAQGLTGAPNITVGIITATSAIVGSAVTINSSGINITGVVTATNFNSTSDISLKEHIHSIEDPLEKVLKINGVGFRWKDTKEDSIGVIAQDIEEILPELVKNNDHIKTVNYNGLIGVLIEAVKEQQRQIEELKSIINK